MKRIDQLGYLQNFWIRLTVYYILWSQIEFRTNNDK